MNNLNMDAIVNMAIIASGVDEELSEVLGDGIGAEALAKAQEQVKQEAEAKLGKQLVSLLSERQKFVQSNVSRIRHLRRQIRQSQSAMDEMDRALAYGKTTGNYIPMAAKLGIALEFAKLGIAAEDMNSMSQVPEDWEPKKSEE